jgi:hypothetical protein
MSDRKSTPKTPFFDGIIWIYKKGGVKNGNKSNIIAMIC